MPLLRTILLLLLVALLLPVIHAQDAPFHIMLKPVTQKDAMFPGLQSYAYAQHGGKWLLIGGRLDGLHRRQPWATFDQEGHNRRIYVIDPETQQWWWSGLETLPQPLQEQLSATNMQFYQNGNALYLIGGYGHSPSYGDHTTFAYLTRVMVSELMNAIVNKEPIAGYFTQISDPQFAVCGGRLDKLHQTYYLVGGQWFDGRYNPRNGPSFEQIYTNQVRRFTLAETDGKLTVLHLPPFTDEQNLHRRDYNLLPQIFPDGRQGLTAFSGVFQHNQDIPFLNSTDIDSSGYVVNNRFSQYLNHYHCATIALYDSLTNQMHSLFFGGIAQYTADQNGALLQDADVPFVPTLARITRFADGKMQEYKLPVEMPVLLGAGAELIKNPMLPVYPNQTLKLHRFANDTVLLGYIYGGIESTLPNIFWNNEGDLSIATGRLMQVYLVKSKPDVDLPLHIPIVQSSNGLGLQLFPNPAEGDFYVHFTLAEPTSVHLSILGLDGEVLFEKDYPNLTAGKHQFRYLMGGIRQKNMLVKVTTDRGATYSQKVVIND
ncbi:MAG TPA: hypothetical protein PK239_07985 [Chitinophagales bacterium]|nr:hypothetical protein [Chitinophagales bacterium]